MKYLIIIVALGLTACGQNSSPEGRMQLKNEVLQLQIDSLKQENSAIKDSLTKIQQQLLHLKQ